MGNHMPILRELILLATLAAIFTVLVVTLLKVLKRAEFFQGRTAVIMAVSLSVLFLVALSQFLVGLGDVYYTTGSGNRAQAASHSLLPGVALGVAATVALSQVLVLANKTKQDEKPELLAKKSEHPVVKPKSPGRPKKAESEHPPTPPKSSGKEEDVAKISTGIERTTTT